MSKMADDAAIEAEEKRRELKECPFCEGEGELCYTTGLAYIECKACLARASKSWNMDSKISISRATAAWNRRGGEKRTIKMHETIRRAKAYHALLADVERVIADAIKYEWQEGIILYKLDTILTRIHNQHKEHKRANIVHSTSADTRHTTNETED